MSIVSIEKLALLGLYNTRLSQSTHTWTIAYSIFESKGRYYLINLLLYIEGNLLFTFIYLLRDTR